MRAALPPWTTWSINSCATLWEREIGEANRAPIVLAEGWKPAKRASSGAPSTAFDGILKVVKSLGIRLIDALSRLAEASALPKKPADEADS